MGRFTAVFVHSVWVLTPGGARLVGPTPSPNDRAAYRSPEELRGEPADVRSDIFAYGAVLYELATGKRAFPAAVPICHRAFSPGHQPR